MGYSHYFNGKAVTKKQLEVLVHAKDLIVRTHLTSGGCAIDDESDATTLNINGVGEDSLENLVIEGIDEEDIGYEFDFVKTNGKNYDVVIVAILCKLNEICPDADVSSDGSRQDWEEGRLLAEQATGTGIIPEGV